MVSPSYINFSVAFYPIAEVFVSCSFCFLVLVLAVCVYPLKVELEVGREREREYSRIYSIEFNLPLQVIAYTSLLLLTRIVRVGL